jgi:protein-S-isoprenylcysteine O-methyltransferase Ste14
VTDGEKPDRPRVVAPPPLIVGAFFASGWGLDRLFPGAIPLPVWKIIGGFFLIGGAILGLWMIIAFLRARTAIEPWKPASALVTNGPLAHTRNPAYLGLICLHAGAAFWFGLGLTLLMLIPAALLLHFGVVLREEAYLTRRFGAEYEDYCKRVRRWV